MTQTIPHKLKLFAAAIIFVVALIAVPNVMDFSAHAESVVSYEEAKDSAKAYADDYDGKEKAKAGLPQFDPSSFSSQIFWLFVFFALLYVIFSKKTLPEISSVIENRRNHIESYTEEAETLRAKAEETQDLYEKGLESARKEAAQMTYDLHEEIQEKAFHKNEFFIEQSKFQIQQLEKKLDEEKQSALTDMNKIAAEVASAAVEKITGIKTKAADAMQVVEGLSDKDKGSKKKAA